jgi:hypothetical protein
MPSWHDAPVALTGDVAARHRAGKPVRRYKK